MGRGGVAGAGDRLGLVDEETGESVPTAMLPYCGRTLLEGLVRDLQAREALHWRLTARQVVTPLALMTSDAKGNHRRLTALLDSLGWFGRCPESFRWGPAWSGEAQCCRTEPATCMLCRLRTCLPV